MIRGSAPVVLVLILAVVLAGGLLGWWAATSRTSPEVRTTSDSDLSIPKSLNEQARWSPIIVTAVAGDAQDVTIDLVGVGGEVKARRVDELRSFRVTRVFKQDGPIPEEFNARAGVSYATWEDSERDAKVEQFKRVDMMPGREYLLFLMPEDPAITGDRVHQALTLAGGFSRAESSSGGFRLLPPPDVPSELLPEWVQEEISASALQVAIANPPPDPTPGDEPANPNAVYTESFAELIELAPGLKSPADAEKLLSNLGMAPGTLPEPIFCRKVQGVLLDLSGLSVDMKCR